MLRSWGFALPGVCLFLPFLRRVDGRDLLVGVWRGTDLTVGGRLSVCRKSFIPLGGSPSGTRQSRPVI
jgi:hypothetical protein